MKTSDRHDRNRIYTMWLERDRDISRTEAQERLAYLTWSEGPRLSNNQNTHLQFVRLWTRFSD